jgi:hypothetical protein
MPHQNGMPTFEELTNMSEGELIQKIDQQFSDSSLTQVGIIIAQIFRDELIRRSQSKSTNAILCLTRVVAVLTFIMVVGLVVQIWLAWE